MGKKKLTFIFHDPNTKKETRDALLRVFLEANREKARQAVRNAGEEKK